MEPFILFQEDHLGCQNAFHKLFLDKPQTLWSILLKQSSSLAVSVISTNCSEALEEGVSMCVLCMLQECH